MRARIVAFPGVMLFIAFSLVITINLAGCQQVAPPAAQQSLPEQYHQGGQRYVIDSEHSEIRLLVYRDGPLARLGHNHVITGKASGDLYVADSLADCGFRLVIPLESFSVDLPGPRSEEGSDFTTVVTESARAGTRHNMLGDALLDAAQYPQITVVSASLQGSRDTPQVSALVMLHGNIRPLQFPARIQYDAGQLTISASFSVLQSELGLQPFSILSGALRVRDAVEIRARLVARLQ